MGFVAGFNGNSDVVRIWRKLAEKREAEELYANRNRTVHVYHHGSKKRNNGHIEHKPRKQIIEVHVHHHHHFDNKNRSNNGRNRIELSEQSKRHIQEKCSEAVAKIVKKHFSQNT